MSIPRFTAAAGVTAALALLAAGCGGPSTQTVSDEPTQVEGQAPAATPAASAGLETCELWLPVDADTSASFRGLSVVSAAEIWVSGTGGTVGRSTNGGDSFAFQVPPGAEALDFRDIDAFAGGVAYAMSAGPGDASQIYKTVDGGDSWALQFKNAHPEGFLDGMAFWDAERGLAYGDPVDGAFFILRTEDGGDTWTRVDPGGLPRANDGEAGFAASGTGVAVGDGGLALIGSGGSAARIFRSTDFGASWTVVDAPLVSGEASQGTFSVALLDAERAVAVGGDYQAPEAAVGNAAYSSDGGVTWLAAETPPAGYRSAVTAAGPDLVAVGTAGADRSRDGGVSWSPTSPQPAVALNAIDASDGPCSMWAVGPDGAILRSVSADAPEG